MKRFLFHTTIILSLFLPIVFIYADTNSGFLDNTIWYSKDNFIEGDTIEIHTAVWNGEASVLEGKVDFMDANTIIGTRSISVPANSLADVSISWKVTAGDHTIKTLIRDTNLKVNGKITPIKFTDNEQSLPKISISKKIANAKAIDDGLADNVSEKVKENLPEQIAEPVSEGINFIDDFRVNTNDKISSLLVNTNKRLEEYNNTVQPEDKSTSTSTKENTKSTTTKQAEKEAPKPLSGTEKPIAYVELFLLTVASFIFKNSIVFYLLCLFIVFIILRFIYRKIRK